MKRIYNLFVAVALLFLSASCEDLIDTEQEGVLSPEEALSSFDLTSANLVSAYNAMQATSIYGRDFVVIPELLADNAYVALVNSGRLLGQANNNPGAHMGNWGTAYVGIDACNRVIQRSEEPFEDIIPQYAIDNMRAEALFLRALYYFDLLRVYAYNPQHAWGGFTDGVPLVLEPFDDEVILYARSSVGEVYTQIEADLNEAISLFQDIDLDDDGEIDINQINEGSNYRADKVAAFGLLSRVHLYQGNWQQSEASCDSVIELFDGIGLAVGADSYGAMFQAPSVVDGNSVPTGGVSGENIFYLSMGADDDLGVNTALGSIYNPTQQGDIVISNGEGGMLELMETYWSLGDESRTFNPASGAGILVSSDTRGPETVFWTRKFTGTSIGTADDIPVIRLSEIYLNRAEARYEQGNAVGAQDDINLIRESRGIPEVNFTAATGPALLQVILNERRIELCFEGHRFFDLVRRGLSIPKGREGANGIPADDFRIINRVPQREIDINPNLTQNPGY